MPRQPGLCVCVFIAASSKGEAAILPGIGWEGRPTWLQAAFNYPESHFNEVLPNALNHSIFHGYLLLHLSLVVNKHLPPAPGHLLGSPSGWWPWMQLIAVGWALHVETQRWGWRHPVVPPLFQIQGCLQGCHTLGLSSPDMIKRLAVLDLCCRVQILLQCFLSWMKSFLGAPDLWKPLSQGPRHCVGRRGGTFMFPLW